MFSPYLYDHKFDIDDLIAALLGGRALYLETRTGTFASAPQEVDDAHRFLLNPLPLEWPASLELHDDYFRLQPAERAELAALILTTTNLTQLNSVVFGPTTLGGWLRERVKDEALQWLANHDLIPPSMRHISGVPKAQPQKASTAAPAGVKKVSIIPS